ncbi:FxsA family protein [Aquirhabdus sp.]|uniref:FxsA family protein n=1 Tax=Aquirhabdus sp. TaxID=2824160 RepID=UPI00396C3055
MNKVLLWLLLLPPIEIFLWIWLAHFVSGWWIFLWTVAAFFIGVTLMRTSLASVMPQLRGQQGGANFQLDPSTDIAVALSRALAGLLFAIPGLLSDVFAVILLLPPIQRWVQKTVVQVLARRQQAMMAQMQSQGFGGSVFGESPFGDSPFSSGGFGQPSRGTVVEGEARTVEPAIEKPKQIGPASANDE